LKDIDQLKNKKLSDLTKDEIDALSPNVTDSIRGQIKSVTSRLNDQSNINTKK